MAEGKLRYYITGNARGFNTALNSAQKRLQGFSTKLSNMSSRLKSISLPLGLAGGAAIKMGMDFDKSMTKITALVGVASEDVDKMRGTVRQLAKDTGKSSTEAAEALFFITSAGLKGADAMQVLEASLKGSAAGLGETKVIADLATSAMNAYKDMNLTATGATDILTAAVREGKLESSELAGAMGQVLPVASAMGVKFNDVGAAMAAMSRTGTPAAGAATQLTAILAGLLKPTTQAEKALAQMGLSSSGLKQQIKDEGLLSVLGTLKERFDANSDAAAQVFPNIRALKGVLDLTGGGAEDAGKIFNSLNNTLGDTQKAFDDTRKSASFKLQQALNGAKETFAELGTNLLNTLLPILTDIAKIVSNAINAFNNLDSGTQKLIGSFGLLIIAGPGILSMLSMITGAISALLGPVGLVAAALVGISYIIYKNWAQIAPELVDIHNRFVDLYNSSEGVRRLIHGIGFAFDAIIINVKAFLKQTLNAFSTIWKASQNIFNPLGMKQVLSDGYDEMIKISDEKGAQMAEAMSLAQEKALKNRMEYTTVDAVNKGLTDAKDGVITYMKDWWNGIVGTALGGGDGTDAAYGQAAAQNLIDSLQKLTGDENQEATENLGNKMSRVGQVLNAIGSSASVVGQGIQDAFLGAFDAMMSGENMFKQLGKMLLDLIKKLVAAALAALVLSTIIGSLGLGGKGKLFEGKGGFDGFKSLFTGFSGVKFAKGGIVSTPTMGLMGEYPGARSNPEVIAPLDKLKGMIANTGGTQVEVGGQFVLKGQDLVVALQRADRNRNRIK